MRIATYNICHCRYAKDGPEEVASVIVGCGADIVGLQEVDVHTNRVSYRNTLEEIAAAAGMPYAAFCPTMPEYRFGAYGTGVVSRLPFSGFAVCPYRDRGREPRAYSRAVVYTNGHSFVFFNTHCAHKEPQVRHTQIRELASVLLATPSFVVTGDFNEEDLAPYLGEGIRSVNAGRRYHTFHPGSASIDHILYSSDLEMTASGMFCTPASDHDLLWADLRFRDEGDDRSTP